MEGLAKLRPLVRFCQIVGFFPFRMEMDLQSGKLKKFTFSYRHPVTWWFIVIQIFGWIHIGIMLLYEKIQTHVDDRLRFCFFITFIIEIFFFIVWRCAGFNISHFGIAVELAIKVDKSLECLPPKSMYKDTITLRIYIGLIITVFLVIFIDYLSRNNRDHESNSIHFAFVQSTLQLYLVFDTFLDLYSNKTVAIFILISQIVTNLQIFSWALSFHLSYYILGHRIKVLRLNLSDDVELHPQVPESGSTISTIPETDVVVVDR